MRGDAKALPFPDESFDAIVSNYVYHNISGYDKEKLFLETLRTLRKGGVFAINDVVRWDIEGFAEKLRSRGYSDVRIIDTASLAFGSKAKASLLLLGKSRMIAGRK